MQRRRKTRWMALALAGFFSVSAGMTSFAASGVWNKQSDGTYLMYDGSSLDGVVARGIDVSKWQGVIDWTQVPKDDIQFVMIGTKARTGLDEQFHNNARNAAQNGVKLGAYIYSQAMTVADAQAEADFVLDLVKDYPISYPIAYDVEDDPTQGKLSKQQLTQVIDAFCNRIKEAGYYPIVYANDYWLTNKIDSSIPQKYPIWVARYNVKHTFATPVMWQASSTGRVAGINGDVDINFQYQSFEGKTPANTWRNIGGKRYCYRNYQPQKSTWVQEQGKWYYLDANGVMTTGWILVNNQWYFMDETGKMLTGTINSNGKTYYLTADGHMLANATVTLNGVQYQADSSGALSGNVANGVMASGTPNSTTTNRSAGKPAIYAGVYRSDANNGPGVKK